MRRLVAVLLVLAVPGTAAAYDPRTDWRTVVSPHFRVHYAAGSYEQALDVARAAETAFAELCDRLAWVPDTPIPIVLADETDYANGFAQSLPYSLIGLNAVGPEELSDLGTLNDWTYGLVAHELTHIVHIDTIRGLPRMVNRVFGRVLVPNSLQPAWLVEGVATYFESALTGAGRVGHPYYDMILRSAVLGGEPMQLDEVTGFPWRWPRGKTPYLYGGWFVGAIVAEHGEEALRRISHDYGARLLPFAVNASAIGATGEDYPAAYERFLAALDKRYRAQRVRVQELGRREGERLTDRGQEIGRARVAADGTLYFVESTIGRHTMLRARDASGEERDVAWVQSGAQLALLPGEREALVSQVEVHRTYSTFNDLFRVDLDGGSVDRLTRGARARAPDVSRDGAWVTFAQDQGRHSVVRLAPLAALERARTVADLGPDTHVWSPRLSPDARTIVFAGARGGQRDIYRVEVDTGVIVNLTADRATDGSPAFLPGGDWIVFHSDRDGIYNLYLIPTAGGRARRLTRVVGGALQPEPNPSGTAVVYRSYGAEGFDLARIELGDPDELPEAHSERHVRAPARRARLEVYPTEGYRPWRTLAPRAWVPVLSFDTQGDVVGVSVSGTDAVGHHRYELSAWYGLFSEFPGVNLRYANRQFHPGVELELSRSLGFAAVPYVRNDSDQAIEEEVWSARAAMTWPVARFVDWSLSLETAYLLHFRDALTAQRFEPTDLTPTFVDQGRFAAVRLAVRFSNVRQYTSSISPEEGTDLRVTLRVEDPWVGSEYSSVSGTISATQYIENPLVERHVLALQAVGGTGDSNYRTRRLFAVGGLPRRDLLLDLLNARLGTQGGLRGFPLEPFVGDVMVRASAEYRLPLLDIESGIETLPFYFQALHLAAFADGAAVADHAAELIDSQHYSVGGELRLDLVFGYSLPLTLRLGYGRGLGGDDVDSMFLVLGNSF